MDDGRGHRDGGCDSVLEELLATPVGRRWLLKAGLGSVVAGAAAGAWSSPAVARRRTGASTSASLQFALGHVRGVSGLVLVANGERLPLVAHSDDSRAALGARGGLWGKMDLSVLTHYVAGVALPADRALVVSVHGYRGGREVVLAQLWHVPAARVLALARKARRLTRSLKSVLPAPERLRALGLRGAELSSAREVAQLATVGDPSATAVALVMFHPDVATIDPTSHMATQSLLNGTPEVQSLGNYITTMQNQGRDFATLVQATDPDGSPSQVKMGNDTDQTTTFKTFQLNPDNDPGFVQSAKSALSAGVRGVRDSAELGAVIDKPLEQQPPAVTTKTWVQSEGVSPQSTPYSRSLAAGAGLDIKVESPGFLFGTQTVVNGSYANGKVPLKIYNNFVRWVWVYVQYLGKDGQNLSTNQNFDFPDTQYSKSLGMLPQVFTVLGVPIWDTNTIDVTLDFPQGAHTARLLYCGLGADALGEGWRQYFPADAYTDGIAPTNEVLVASLITGFLTIGLNVFALATDMNVATTWATIRQGIAGASRAEFKELATIAARTVTLTKAELAAASVASGAATYEDIKANGGNAANIWSILLSLASVIPKVILAPRPASQILGRAGAAIFANEAGDKVIESIPFIGQMLAVIEAVGDAVTLAEVATETILSPWVIKNEVTLTYGATVTIKKDSGDPTFPATARSWRLEASVDGAAALSSVTGQINQGGKLQSDPLVLKVVAPFGGKEIQWSVVMLDQAGKQVGTGASAKFENDDPDHVPSTVEFAITELPPTITGATVFKRSATTTYSTADQGYTWSDEVSVSGTVDSGGVDEVTGAAIATVLGVAGVVWKQDDRYWLRGVPVAQNGSTIKLGVGRTEGYARRPFLLFDSMVEKGDQGNHVLLEPDATTDAYHVRRLTIDPETGALDWDPAVSLGMFTLPVSAATLHSSGRVVALHTDSGRVGWLLPAATPRPQLAAYSGGPGTQVGLLNSPIALAVTNPGILLMLEAGGPQLAAFDLNGNPVRYFTPGALRGRPRRPAPGAPGRRGRRRAPAPRRRLRGAELAFTLPLDEAKTYLDLAVDGAAQIYLLHHTGDGSDVQDYHVDVYTPTGGPLDTNSPGVNVPHLAVDYWRSIYAPNYDPLTDQGTTSPHKDPNLGVIEPSLSRFDPTNPATRTKPKPK
jgi:hypothetical protein